MKRLVSLILISLLVLLPALASCDGTPGGIDGSLQQKTMKATGSAYVLVNPDCADIHLGIDTYDTQSTNAFQKNQDIVKTVIDAMVALGLSKDGIFSTKQTLTTVYGSAENSTSAARIRGYRVVQEIVVHVDDLSRISEVITQAVAQGVSTVDEVVYGCSNPDAIHDEVLSLAIQEAKRKAALMAKENNVAVGEVISLEEVPYETANIAQSGNKNDVQEQKLYSDRRQMIVFAEEGTQTIDLMSTEQEFTAKVIITFAID